MSDISQRIAGLSPEKLALLMQRLKAKGGTSPAVQPISKRIDETEHPLSFAQQRLWFIDQLEPGNYAHNILTATRFKGTLDLPAMRRAIDEIIRRHEALRATFHSVDGQPKQVVVEAWPDLLQIEDLRAMPEAQRNEEVLRRANDEALAPFNLAVGPMLRARLMQLRADEYVLLFTMHHIISDGWSRGVLIQEFATLYQAFAQGLPSPLPDLPIQYPDYAAWQREWLQGEVLHAQLEYWKRQFEEGIPVLELATDHVRPPRQTFNGARHHFALHEKLTAALEELARRESVTLFIVLLTAFKVLLMRYSDQEEIVVGTPVANRSRVETEGLIGFFANTLALRVNLAGDGSFREALARVRQVALGAYAHQDLPFEKLVEELRPDRDLSRTPIFQVMFVLDNTPMETIEVSGLSLNPLQIEGKISAFDLSMHLEARGDTIKGSLEYNTDLFEEATIKEMAHCFRTLLEGIIDNPDQRLTRLPLMSEAERHQLLSAWRGSATAESGPETLAPHLFEAQVERTPDHIAVEFEQQQLTYRELDACANQLAHYLRKRGVGPEDVLGIYMNRSVDLIVSMLGVLKTGAAYLPLDPAYPRERQSLILRDARARLLLTQQELSDETMAPDATVYVDRDWPLIAQESRASSELRLTGENLAYIIYTSGSTGRPKGVQIPHHALASYTKAAIRAYGIQVTNRVLQFAPVSFDTSVEEIYPCLASGATLVIRTEAMISTIPTFLRECAEKALTFLTLPTAYWHELVAVMCEEDLPFPSSVRLVVIGGERANPKHWFMWKKRMGQRVQLVNTYGPTETTVVATAYALTETERASATWAVPIGRPLANARTYVLDRHLQPVPAGLPGELYIGGGGLARGYLREPAMTALKFVPDPFAQEPGARIYRTGDLAKHRSDNTLEFVGRADRQVKVRGFRVELGEIESALETHPQVAQAFVMLRKPFADEALRLFAYIVSSTQGYQFAPGELRAYLKEKLPEYMIPAGFVVIDKLPLTPTGKINWRLLPEIDPATDDRQVSYVAPRTKTEEALAEIWATALNVGPVGIHDNFFELGGHSLLATRLISALNKTFGIELPLRDLFESPTVAALATIIEQKLTQLEPESDGAMRAMDGYVTTGGLRPADAPEPPYEAPNGNNRTVLAPDPSTDARQLLGKVDSLSESEINALLRRLLSDQEQG
jgi:amino acid adenylation domain-containing protein